jgi:DNA-binding NarL/FixJ family response regulator
VIPKNALSLAAMLAAAHDDVAGYVRTRVDPSAVLLTIMAAEEQDTRSENGPGSACPPRKPDPSQDGCAMLIMGGAAAQPAEADPGDATSASVRPPRVLSARELEVLSLLLGGLGKKDIASGLGMSPATVARHVANIQRRLSVDVLASESGSSPGR